MSGKRVKHGLSFFIATILATLTVSPALALSCAPFTVSDAFKLADESPDRHVVVVGKLAFDEQLLPKTDWQNQLKTPKLTRIPAKIAGRFLNKDGFKQPYSTALTLEVRCFGPWCGGAKSGGNYMAFINIDQRPATVQASPCGAGLIARPTMAHVRQAQSCINKGPCDGPSLRALPE